MLRAKAKFQFNICSLGPPVGEFIELFHVFDSEAKTGGRNGFLQLLGIARADDRGGDERIAQEPGQGHLGNALIVVPTDLFHLVQQVEISLAEIILHTAVIGSPGVGGNCIQAAEFAGEKTHRLRAIGDDRDPFRCYQIGQLALEVVAFQQAIVGLDAIIAAASVLDGKN